MSGTLVLISLSGYVGLLLWGTHMVGSGVQRVTTTAGDADLAAVAGRVNSSCTLNSRNLKADGL